MRRLSMGGRLNQKKFLYVAIVGLVALAVLIIWLLQSHNKSTTPSISMGNNLGLSNTALISADSKSAQNAAAVKDYQTAISHYTEAVNTAESDGNYDQAETLLKDAINIIPDSNVPWVIYDDLVGVAKAKGDKNLEISSIKKAIIKAQKPNSGAPTGIVAAYQKMLKQLGTS